VTLRRRLSAALPLFHGEMIAQEANGSNELHHTFASSLRVITNFVNPARCKATSAACCGDHAALM
jgi:hypothetical protein